MQRRAETTQRKAEEDYQRRVEAEMRYLDENHECEHTSWDRVSGRHMCEHCRDTLPFFILECDQCRLRACVRCRRNRILV